MVGGKGGCTFATVKFLLLVEIWQIFLCDFNFSCSWRHCIQISQIRVWSARNDATSDYWVLPIIIVPTSSHSRGNGETTFELTNWPIGSPKWGLWKNEDVAQPRCHANVNIGPKDCCCIRSFNTDSDNVILLWWMCTCSCARERNGEYLILLCQQQSFGLMFTFVQQRGCTTSSFFQSPHLGGQIGQFVSSNELGKINWA